MTGSSHHRFTKRKSFLINLIAFHNEMTGLVDKERAVDIVDLDYSETFNTLSHSILTDEVQARCMDGEPENGLNWQALRAVISARKSTGGLFLVIYTKGSLWAQHSLTSSLIIWVMGIPRHTMAHFMVPPIFSSMLSPAFDTLWPNHEAARGSDRSRYELSQNQEGSGFR